MLWRPALETTHKIGIKNELKHRATARILRQFRIYNIVRPAAELTRLVDSKQNVCAPTPATVAKCRLHNGAGAFSHGCDSALDSRGAPNLA